MKQSLFFLLVFAGLLMTSNVSAINSGSSLTIANTAIAQQVTVNDFLSVDFKQYRTPEGKKLGWVKRMALNQFQKGLAKKVNNGKIEGTASLQEAMKANNPNKYGLLSLIFSIAGLIMLFTPIGIVGMALGIAGFVLGLIGLKRDTDMTMSLIGTIVGGLVILLTLIAIIWVAAFLSGF